MKNLLFGVILMTAIFSLIGCSDQQENLLKGSGFTGDSFREKVHPDLLGRYSIVLPKAENLWGDAERNLWNNPILPAFWVIGNSSASIFEVPNTDFGREFLKTTPVLVKGIVHEIRDSVWIASDEIHIGFGPDKIVKCHFESSEYNLEDLNNIEGTSQFILGTVF